MTANYPAGEAFPSPPFPPGWGFASYGILSSTRGSLGTLVDNDGFPTTGADFVGPYIPYYVFVFQTFQFSCPCSKGGAWQNLSPSITGALAVDDAWSGWNGQWVYENGKANLAPASQQGAISVLYYLLH